MKFGAYTDLVEFIPFFFLIHPRFNGGIGILYMTVRHVCRCVFRLGQNALRCSAIVDEERLPFVFLKVHFTHMCIYFFTRFERWVVLCDEWWVYFSCSYLLGLSIKT